MALSFRSRLLLWLVPVGAGAAGLFGYHLLEHTTELTREALGRELRAIATTLAASIDGDAHAGIRVSTDDAFVTIRDRMRESARRTGIVSPIYTMRPVEGGDNRCEFVVMTNETPFVGDQYTAVRAEIAAVFVDGRARYSEVYIDEHGEWLSGYAPILRRDGSVEAILEVDYSANEVRMAEAAARRDVLAAVGIGVVVAALISILIAHWVSNPMRALRTRLVKMRPAGPEMSDSPRTSNEFDALYGAIDEFAAAIRTRDAEREARIRALEEVDQLKDSILSTLSHELQTPVATIAANAEILRDFGDESMSPEDRAAFLSDLNTACDRLSHRVRSILKLVSLQGSGVVPRWREVELGQFGPSLVEGLDTRGVRVVWICDQPEAAISYDEESVGTALACVLDNAVRNAKAEVAVRCSIADAAVRVVVTDDGPGVPEDVQPFLFGVFEQGTTRKGILTDKPEGIGVGLALARASLRCAGGDVELEETGPAGSAFALRFPLRECSPLNRG